MPPKVIAELSGNHNGSIEKALSLIAIADNSGADAVKLQCYTPDTITLDCERAEFKWKGKKLYDLYQEAHTPWDWFPELFAYAKELGIEIFSSVFDRTSIDFLEKLACPCYKIASFEIVDIPLIRYAADTGKPLIISTGMAHYDEIMDALNAASSGHRTTTLLHCVSGYPTPLSEANLWRINELKQVAPSVGLSDHTLGSKAAVAATALGASMIEKHLTIARDEGGPDAEFSAEPHEFEAMVNAVHDTYDALQVSDRHSEKHSIPLRRSLYVVKDMRKGEPFTDNSLRSIRPGCGLEPKHYDLVIGKLAARDLERGTPLSWELIDG